MFDWNDLRFFIEVTRARSLSGAAAKLGVNHTTVARRIQALEESLAVQLFDKTPAGYKLTATGTQLLRLAERVESACISAEELLAGQDPMETGVVRLSVPEGFGAHFLAKRLGEFHKLHPRIELEIVALPEELSISKREAHIAITLTKPSVGRLVARALTNYTLHLYATRTYLRKAPPARSLADLKQHQMITNIVSVPQYDFLAEILSDVQAKLRFKSINAQLSAVEAGLGISLMPRYMAGSRKSLAPVLPEQARVTRTFWMSMHEDMRHVRRVMTVWDWLKALAAAHQDDLVGPAAGEAGAGGSSPPA
jgi:DNA-binding transcriptional LysR family regulator